MKRRRSDIPIHLALIAIAAITLLPFFFVINNSFRRTTEVYHGFFGVPAAAKDGARFTWMKLTGHSEDIRVRVSSEEQARGGESTMTPMSYGDAMRSVGSELSRGYRFAWNVFRPYMLNSLFVSGISALGVIVIGSVTAYVLSRHEFPGRRALFLVIISFMMIPGVLTLVPSVLWCKKLGLLNSYWVLILPYVTTGQIIAIFLFKGFFDALPQDLFEAARIDGAGHLSQYWHIVLPLSKQIISVVAIMSVLGTWNNFLWPLITNTDAKYAVVSSGLFIMSQSQSSAQADNSVMFAAYVISAIPLLILFLYATKPFMTGVTSGAFKA